MSESKLHLDNGGRGQWKRSFLKYTLAVLTVLCGVGGAMYITGAGKHLKNALQRIVKAETQTPR